MSKKFWNDDELDITFASKVATVFTATLLIASLIYLIIHFMT